MRLRLALCIALAGGCTVEQSATVNDLGGIDLAMPAVCAIPLPTCTDVDMAPSYNAEVAPLVEAYCVGCHNPKGLSPKIPLGSYAALAKDRGAVLDQLYNCVMPPTDAGQPSVSQREQILDWLVCLAPNN